MIALLASFVFILAALFYFLRRSMRFLAKDEQLRVEGLTDVSVINGPGLKLISPFASSEKVKAETLGTLDFVRLRDSAEGTERIERGPKQLFLGPYEKVEHLDQGISLSSTDYVLVENKLTGENKVVIGPCVWFPETAEEEGRKGAGISMSNNQYVLVEDTLSGKTKVERGPGVWFPGPMEKGSKGTAMSLSSTEYVLITDKESGEKRVEKGPCVWFPGPFEEGEKGFGKSLGNTDYVIVENKVSGERRVEKGPCVWFPGPEEAGQQGCATSLSNREYIIVEDKLTGEQSMVKGPCVWFPKPYDEPSAVNRALALQDDEYIKLKDLATGRRWVQKGKALVFLEPTWKVETLGQRDTGIKKAWVLKVNEYVRLIDNVTGKVTSHRGEATVFPEPDEELLDADKLPALDLKVNEYVKILDQATGEIRVVAGANQVYLGPHEKVLDGGKQKAIEVDDEHAVLVRNKSTGQLHLVTDNQLFVPGPHESIEEVRELIRLADHEALIIKDKDGNFKFYFGSEEKRGADQARSFFLPPYAETVKLCWSRGRRREKRDLFIERFDCRAQYMSFEFNCRTKDNVELILEGTFFWEVVDLPLMVATTGDTPGDICARARSQFIKHVAQANLKEFMDDLNALSQQVYKEDLPFYESRGVKVHSLEVTSYQCANSCTSEVLQQIIQETTNRMNRISQAESENEVNLFRMQGQIEQEKLNGQLLGIQHEHSQAEAKVNGAADADRITAFINGLEESVPKLEDRIAMWQTLRKTDALSVVSQGGASLYYTPNDVDLSIETKRAASS
mmetsp:Transcript_124872/g.243066  ORF Transcript_124872/g.243066 Transcript_124872/m.243066 type:complete len:792 (-) Transcript_124872:425-2800(-)